MLIFTCTIGRGSLIYFTHMQYNKNKIHISLKKTISLSKKIDTMVEKNTYCIDIMQQILAAIGLLRSVNENVLEGHLQTCFRKTMETKNVKKQQEMICELIKVMKVAQKK
ncbi:metal-sensitive transcriptional regulator [Candidatus Peregrinibacteria bacterium]|nr:metal-sensitive transcriptional regulator [Candidatus Peregrinibacteria bacterium]